MFKTIITKEQFLKYDKDRVESKISKLLKKLEALEEDMCYGNNLFEQNLYNYNHFIDCNLKLRDYISVIEVPFLAFGKYSDNIYLTSKINLSLLGLAKMLRNLMVVYESGVKEVLHPSQKDFLLPLETEEERQESINLLRGLVKSNVIRLRNIHKESYA